MTPFQQTALDFCRECMGCEPAVMLPNGDLELRFAPPRGFSDFRYTDLNVVLEAVRRWCDNRGLWIEIHSYAGNHWQVEMGRYGHRHWLASLDRESLTETLLAACVEAHRKLKGITHE